MAIDWSKFQGVSGDILTIVQPYLPALARQGDEVIDGFIMHMSEKDWSAVDELMYKRMTQTEREFLDQQVLSGAIAAAQAQYERIQLTKEILWKVLLRLLIAGL